MRGCQLLGRRLTIMRIKMASVNPRREQLLRFHPRSNRVKISGPTRANAGTFAEELIASEIRVGGCCA